MVNFYISVGIFFVKNDIRKSIGWTDMQSGKRSSFLWEMGRGTAWFLGTLGSLFVLLVLSVSIPNDKIRSNLLDSATYLSESEELFFQLREGDRRTEIHNYADATTLNILYSIEGENLLWEVVLSPFYSDRMNIEKSVTELLEERIVSECPADTVYDRYWHGMILILKPLLTLFTLQQVRWIFLGMLIVCAVVLTILLLRKKQYLPAVLVWLGALSVQIWMAAFCVEYFPVFLIAFLISVAMISMERNRNRILDLCVVSGVCVAFFDFLTTETLAFVLPMALVYVLWNSNGRIKKVSEELLYLFRAACCWAGAYVFTYLMKWGLASIACGEERFSVALMQLAGRQGNTVTNFAMDSLSKNQIPADALQNAGGEILPQFVSAIVINIRLLLGLSGKITLEKLMLLLVMTGLLLAVFIYLFRKQGRMEPVSIILLLLGTIPMLRMMVLNNHSIEHCFFVYRSLYGTIVCYGAGVLTVIDWEFLRRRKKHGSTRVKKQR